MKGWRTLAFNLTAAILPVLQATDLTAVLSPQGLATYGAVVAVANIGLRVLTTTPMGKDR